VLKRSQVREADALKKASHKSDLEEKRAFAPVNVDMDAFNMIVAELQERYAAVLDIEVIDATVCVFSQKREMLR
jgi:hypothetical protein